VLAAWILMRRGSLKWAQRFLGAASAAMLVMALLPVGEWVLYPLETRFQTNPPLPDRVDGIIVLGGMEDAMRTASWDQVELNDSAERFTASIMLSRRYPDAKLLFTSGSGSVLDQKHKGASVAHKFYAEQGLDISKIVFESQSRNTVENARLSQALVKPAPGQKWILVTSAFHMPRSVGIFCRIGWNTIPYPVDHRALLGQQFRINDGLGGNLNSLGVGMREWIGLVAYYVTGKTSALFPSGCP
jgi:uncharacterized SAM-binding protein YcdF (DUF218 family)